jgi:hypothetical protein
VHDRVAEMALGVGAAAEQRRETASRTRCCARSSTSARPPTAAGDIRVAFESMPAHFPPDESLFAGLPDDRCQCPHWGYLAKGSFTVSHLGGPDEVVRAGDVHHLRPGHFVQTLEPVELIEFSPVGAHDATMAVVAANVAAAIAS